MQYLVYTAQEGLHRGNGLDQLKHLGHKEPTALSPILFIFLSLVANSRIPRCFWSCETPHNSWTLRAPSVSQSCPWSPDLYEAQPNFFIKIVPDMTNPTITIEDSGIRITRNELVNNCGTIAKSETKAFMQAMSAGGALVSVRRVWFQTMFVWSARAPTMSSTSGGRRRADPSPCRLVNFEFG